METEKTINPLFPEFPPVSKDKWKETVLKDLKGGSFEKLLWKTYEGFQLEPLYTKEDLGKLSYLQAYENIGAGENGRTWENREKIKVENEGTANRLAIEALHGGVDGIAFEILKAGDIDFSMLFNGYNLENTWITFIIKSAPAAFLNNFFGYLEKINFPLSELKGNLEFDSLSTYILTGSYEEENFAELADAIKLSLKAPDFYPLTINGKAFSESGGNAVQELAFTMGMAAFYLEKLISAGLTAGQVAGKTQFSMAIGTSYFMEIAKLKVLRILFLHIAKAFGAQDFKASNVRIHASSSLWSKTFFDPSVNLLRDTTEAMSAILGGCNSLTIEPYDADYKNPQPFLKRIARNVSAIIKEESYLDKVADPAAGSYYIQNLMDELARNSWALFQEVENSGGFFEAFNNGLIQEKIKAVREAKKSKIANRRDTIVGTNQYPNTREQVDPENAKSAPVKSIGRVEVLVPQRAADEFETLRLDTEKHVQKTGKRPKAFLLEYGSQVAMRKARSGFSLGFLGTAGFDIIEDDFAPDVNAAIEKAKSMDAEIVVFCASDDDYVAVGEDFARQFKSQIKGKQLVLAGYPAESVEKLKAAGFDEFIHIRSNAVETLRGFQKKLNII